jgi:hypothetical protein
MNAAHAAALVALEAGLCVLPPRQNGTKAPDAETWTEYQSRRSTADEIAAWYAGNRTGVGVVCGAISGGLEMLELEGRAVAEGVPDRLRELAQAAGLGETLSRILAGYLELTPSGGFHLLYRVPTPLPSAKLARRPATPAELAEKPGDRIKVLIETRGEGGYVVTAPSNGRVHPTGAAWRLVAGGFDSIATIGDAERDELFRLAAMLDAEPPRVPAGTTDDGERPGDLYNALPDVQERTLELLTAHGWTEVYRQAGIVYLRRPGKDRGISATLGHAGPGVLYVFSTSTEFEAPRAHNAFGVFAKLEHGGDFAAAARALYPGIVDAGTATRQAPATEAGTSAAPAAGATNLIVGIDEYRASVPAAIPWVARPLAYLGGVSLIAGPPKAGKSTLAAQMQRCRETGERLFGAWDVTTGPTLLVTEEGGVAVVHKAEGLHALDVLDRRSAVRAELTFRQMLGVVSEWSATRPGGLAFIDTLAIWAGIVDENDAGQATRAIAAVTATAQAANLAIVLVHHARKRGGDDGEAVRGSGAILATVDIAIELSRVGPGRDDRYLDIMGRVIAAERFELAFDRATKAYTLADQSGARLAAIEADLEGIPAAGPGLIRAELQALWKKDPRARAEQLVNVGRMRAEYVKTGRSYAWRYWSIPAAWTRETWHEN